MILASQSPRRIELMREAGYNIRVIPADIDETPFDGEAPLTLVERLARAKAAAVTTEHAEPNELTVAADTIVTFDGQISGKPQGERGRGAHHAAASFRPHAPGRNRRLHR